MEKEALIWPLNYLISMGLNIAELVTDRNVQIRKYMREAYPKIKHMFDIWHFAKDIIKMFQFSVVYSSFGP